MIFQYVKPGDLNAVGVTHVLKIDDSCVFAALRCGAKNYEWRKEDDRHFQVGDKLKLVPDWLIYADHGPVEARNVINPVEKLVVSILRGGYGVPDGYVILGLADIEDGFEHLFDMKQTEKHLDVLFPGVESK